MYDIVVADARAPRDGRFIEKLGTYDPNQNPHNVVLQADRAVDWLLKGAQPTDTARSILHHEGVMLRKHLQVGVNKGAVTQENADARFEEWKNAKSEKLANKADTLNSKKTSEREQKLEAERKVNQARIESITKKNTPPADTTAPETEAEEPVNESAETEIAATSIEEQPEAVEETTAATEAPAEQPAAEAPAEQPAAEAPQPVAEKAEETTVVEEAAPAADQASEPVAEAAPVATEATAETEVPVAEAQDTPAAPDEKSTEEPTTASDESDAKKA
ncbi:30S ribosomal protein S16 [Salmonirosea aquatica]